MGPSDRRRKRDQRSCRQRDYSGARTATGLSGRILAIVDSAIVPFRPGLSRGGTRRGCGSRKPAQWTEVEAETTQARRQLWGEGGGRTLGQLSCGERQTMTGAQEAAKKYERVELEIKRLEPEQTEAKAKHAPQARSKNDLSRTTRCSKQREGSNPAQLSSLRTSVIRRSGLIRRSVRIRYRIDYIPYADAHLWPALVKSGRCARAQKGAFIRVHAKK